MLLRTGLSSIIDTFYYSAIVFHVIHLCNIQQHGGKKSFVTQRSVELDVNTQQL